MKTSPLTICLYSFAQSEWLSCKRIVPNLVKAYENFTDNEAIVFYNFSREHTEHELLLMAEKILKEAPTKIVFLDHQPHPANLLSIILPRLSPDTEIIIHTYGGFLLPFPDYWVKLEKNLRQFKVKFINASLRQKNFLQQFLKQDEINFTCPFPVDTNSFNYNSKLRNHFRSQLNLTNEFVWLYTGRLNQQKNIHKLIKSFAAYKKKTGSSDKLFLAGAFDHLGVPFQNIIQLEHEYFHLYQHYFKKIPTNIQGDIHHLGAFYGQELNGIYNAADAFISLSTYNDEDFGMSVAEAICVGLPCVLTDWGGYSSFKQYGRVELIPLTFKNGALSTKENDLIFRMQKIKSLNQSRDSDSREAQTKLGIAAATNILSLIHDIRSINFQGFSKNLSDLIGRWSKGNPFSNGKNQFNSYYKKTYEAYFK